MIEDFEGCYRAVSARDARFDGWFFVAVTSTGIYCRPSCPALTPKRSNVRFFSTAAAAQNAGFRACKRCRPDATPGSPEWNIRSDLTARAMRLIADGIVDREGVAGLAKRLHFSERHIHRQLVAEVGAGPQALSRAHRAQTARILIETTTIRFSEVAFAAGFASIRQFNDTIRDVFASSPSELRRRRHDLPVAPGVISLRLPARSPFDGRGVLAFLGKRAVPGIEEFDGDAYRRTLDLPHSSGVVSLTPREEHVDCVLRLDDLRDLTAAVQRCRRLLDLDADPIAAAEVLSKDRGLRKHVRRVPGRRVPGSVEGAELAFRAVLGQQVSVAGARTLAARLVSTYGKPLTHPDDGLTHLFPSAEVLADSDLSKIGMPASRRNTLRTLAQEIAEGRLSIDPGADRDETRTRLMDLPGIGPWTASYIEMRALSNPDAWLPTDLGVKKALAKLGRDRNAEEMSLRWRPWRAYAVQYLWASIDKEER
jgi:AraC family transcriptional regulator of adaptative response / DNA-3-methyladenine glycosylase II